MAIYKANYGFIISSGGVWLPGIYETKGAAHQAFRLDIDQLDELSKRICRYDGENRTITLADIRAVQLAAKPSTN